MRNTTRSSLSRNAVPIRRRGCGLVPLSSRFDPYTQRPLGCTTTCADQRAPCHPSRRVEMFWISRSTPRALSQAKAVIVESSSLIT